MKLWEIKDIESGVRIYNAEWPDNYYIVWNEEIEGFLDQEGHPFSVVRFTDFYYYNACDEEIYE